MTITVAADQIYELRILLLLQGIMRQPVGL
jgi:hypothetical protein